ncbi:MAG: hypothetical protein EOM03_14325 [Clostridia bacterium]|nr:hypothetical protein [Clostridia bacterium]
MHIPRKPYTSTEIARWIDNRCVKEKAAIWPVYSLHADWKAWCVDTKQTQFLRYSERRFASLLQEMGFERQEHFEDDCFLGLRLTGRISIIEEWIIQDYMKSWRCK